MQRGRRQLQGRSDGRLADRGRRGAVGVEVVGRSPVLVEVGEGDRRGQRDVHDGAQIDAFRGQRAGERRAEAVVGECAEERRVALEARDRAADVEGRATRMRLDRAVEADDQVEERLSGDQDHGAISPEPRSISVVGTMTRLVGDVSPSMRAKSSSAAVRPSSETFCATTLIGWIQQIGELEVVEADDRDRALKPERAQGVECGGGDEVLSGEEGRRRVGEREQLPHRRVHTRRICEVRALERRVLGDAQRRERIAIALQSRLRRVQLCPIGEEPDAAMTALGHAADRSRRGLGIVGEYGVRVEEGGRAVDEDEGEARVALAREVAVILPGGDDDQAVDAPRAERERELALEVRALVRARREREDAPGARDVLDRAVHVREEGVGDVLEDEADARRHAIGAAQRAGRIVTPVPEHADRLVHAPGEVGIDRALAVDDARDRLDADIRERRDLTHRRTSFKAGGRQSEATFSQADADVRRVVDSWALRILDRTDLRFARSRV